MDLSCTKLVGHAQIRETKQLPNDITNIRYAGWTYMCTQRDRNPGQVVFANRLAELHEVYGANEIAVTAT